jgi:uncharacterized membrane protein
MAKRHSCLLPKLQHEKKFYAPYVLLALAVVGIAVAFYDAYQLYYGQALWCPPPISGCNEVANSSYARIYNLPVGYFGVESSGGQIPKLSASRSVYLNNRR